MSYQKPPPYFANRVVRLLTKTAAAQEIGPEGCWLVSIIAFTEDAKHRTGPVLFFNHQLAPLCGFSSIDRLIRVREKAVQAGWLHYEPGGKGIAGVYWPEIPARYANLPDGATDQSADLPLVSSRKTREKAEDKPRESRGEPDCKHQTFLPISSPIPIPEEKPATASAADISNTELLYQLIDRWNELPPEIVRTGKAKKDKPARAVIKGWRRVQRDPEAQEPFSDPERLIEAIRRAKFCHRQGWFSFVWLFGTNKNGEWNAVKLLQGGYDDDRHCRSNNQERLSVGPGQRYDPAATMPNDW